MQEATVFNSNLGGELALGMQQSFLVSCVLKESWHLFKSGIPERSEATIEVVR